MPVTCANDARDQRLRQAGEVLDQHVAVGEDPEQDELERLALADDRRARPRRGSRSHGGRRSSTFTEPPAPRSFGELGRRDASGWRFEGGCRSGRTSSQSSSTSTPSASLEPHAAGGQPQLGDLAQLRPQPVWRSNAVDEAIVSSRSSRSSPGGRSGGSGSSSSATAISGTCSSGYASRSRSTTSTIAIPPSTRTKMSSSSSYQPGASSRATAEDDRRRAPQEEPREREPLHAATAVSASAPRGGRPASRSRRPSSSGRSRAG